jgi:hypothetical protein
MVTCAEIQITAVRKIHKSLNCMISPITSDVNHILYPFSRQKIIEPKPEKYTQKIR